jgi:hypothetical protein
MRWYEEEERYLKILHDMCVQLAKEYMQLYVHSHKIQTKLRLPSIILSSLSGVASFGSSSFGDKIQRYISISVGIVNVGIAIVQTYESYLKIGEIVSKSLSCSISFKKLADIIYCEIFIPVEDRNANGITFLRDCFSRYQTILDQSPPLEFHGLKYSDTLHKAQAIMETIRTELGSTPSIRRSRFATDDCPPEVTVNIVDNVLHEPHQPDFKDMKSIILNHLPKKPEVP